MTDEAVSDAVVRRRARSPLVHVHRDQVEGWTRLGIEHAHYKTLAEQLEKQARTDTAKLNRLKELAAQRAEQIVSLQKEVHSLRGLTIALNASLAREGKAKVEIHRLEAKIAALEDES